MSIENQENNFVCTIKDGKEIVGKRLLLATGIMDRLPSFPEIYPCLGVSVFVCPDCDGYEVKNEKTVVIGSGDVGANMALTLSYWTNEIMYINHEKREVSEQNQIELRSKNIIYHEEIIDKFMAKGSQFKGVCCSIKRWNENRMRICFCRTWRQMRFVHSSHQSWG